MDEQHVTYIMLQDCRPSPLYSERYSEQYSKWYSERETAVASHLSIGTIRHLHALGLIEGEETDGKRLYREEEVMQLRRIRRLRYDLGVNLAGIEVILHLLKRLEAAHQELVQERNRTSI